MLTFFNIALWIRLHPPSCGPGFESQPPHQCLSHFSQFLCYICLCVKKRTEIKVLALKKQKKTNQYSKSSYRAKVTSTDYIGTVGHKKSFTIMHPERVRTRLIFRTHGRRRRHRRARRRRRRGPANWRHNDVIMRCMVWLLIQVIF